MLSGVMGTVTSIGGPPVALMFHDAGGPELRGTLAGYFMLSTAISLGGLWMAGMLHGGHVQLFVDLTPGVLIGLLVSTFTRRYLDRGRTRVAVLSLSAVSALAVFLKYI